MGIEYSVEKALISLLLLLHKETEFLSTFIDLTMFNDKIKFAQYMLTF